MGYDINFLAEGLKNKHNCYKGKLPQKHDDDEVDDLNVRSQKKS